MENCDFELLAPVADWDMLLAAVHNGADAIYLGMAGYNARGRSPDYDLATVRKYLDYCHLYGVKAHIAFNVLLFQDEIERLLPTIQGLLDIGPDAIIVQDIGLARLIRKLSPRQILHASTQMTTSSSEAIEATRDLEIQRYILARELSIPDLKVIRNSTDKELEVFVHGALCVAYSGQCLTSESFGGRSANRGQCAQSCRFDYELVVDGTEKYLVTKKYLVSPKDLCALPNLEELYHAGIRHFKIEGRYKSPEYVAYATRAYRQRLLALSTGDNRKHSVTRDVDNLSIIYSRGFSDGWLRGQNHQHLVDPWVCSHHGLEIGTIVDVAGKSIFLTSSHELAAGDGLVFCDFSKNEEFGTQVYEASRCGSQKWRLSFANDFKIGLLKTGMHAYLNSSPSLEKEIRLSFSDKSRLKRISLHAVIRAKLGDNLRLRLSDEDGHSVEVQSEHVIEPAKTNPTTIAAIEDELGALSGTCFSLRDLSADIPCNAFINLRDVKRLRQEGTKLLEAQRVKIEPSHPVPVDDLAWQCDHIKPCPGIEPPKINVLIRNAAQLSALKDVPIDTVYLEYEYGKDYAASIQDARNMGFKAGIATSRIFKPSDSSHINRLLHLQPDVALVRNLGAFERLKHSGLALVCDFSLNCSNSLSFDFLVCKGFERICPSYDLNSAQLYAMLEKSDASRCEITVHQYMPTFHMEFCVFAAYLSKGSSYRNCGKPCERHRVELKDRTGVRHPVTADGECRNTMFNGLAQSAARLVPDLMKHGVSWFRVEALLETPAEFRAKLLAYDAIIHRSVPYPDAFNGLRILERYGLSEGQLSSNQQYVSRKKSKPSRLY